MKSHVVQRRLSNSPSPHSRENRYGIKLIIISVIIRQKKNFKIFLCEKSRNILQLLASSLCQMDFLSEDSTGRLFQKRHEGRENFLEVHGDASVFLTARNCSISRMPIVFKSLSPSTLTNSLNAVLQLAVVFWCERLMNIREILLRSC